MKSKIELYEELKAKLPLTRKGDNFVNYVEEVLNDYLSLIKEVDFDQDKMKIVNEFITEVKEVINKGLNGDKGCAYKSVVNGALRGAKKLTGLHLITKPWQN
jgi:hypothetical protein